MGQILRLTSFAQDDKLVGLSLFQGDCNWENVLISLMEADCFRYEDELKFMLSYGYALVKRV